MRRRISGKDKLDAGIDCVENREGCSRPGTRITRPVPPGRRRQVTNNVRTARVEDGAVERIQRPRTQWRRRRDVRVVLTREEIVAYFDVPARRAGALELRAYANADVRIRCHVGKRIRARIARRRRLQYLAGAVQQLYGRGANRPRLDVVEIQSNAVVGRPGEVRGNEFVLHNA